MNGRITNRPKSINRVILPRVGRIKIGMKAISHNGREYPKSVDYFIPTGKYASLFTQAYGEKPQTIQIIFPDDDANKVCREEYQYRDDAGKIIASGDGETFQVWNGTSYSILCTKDYPNIMDSVIRRYPTKRGQDGWQITLTMNFIIPLVRGIAGVWQFVSKGTASTIPNLRDSFDAMLAQRGFVKGIIWDMSVQFATSQKPNDKSKYPVVSLVPNESKVNILKVQEALKPIKLLSNQK